MVVIYAEKHDMAVKIASALGGNTFQKSDEKNGFYKIQYRGMDHAVTWGSGHLCTLANASEYNEEYKNWSKMPIPFIPDEYKIVLNLKSRNPVAKLYANVKKVFAKADWIINATDFDREGELIFYYLYSYMRCTKPVMRVKLSSTTKEGILESFNNLMQSSDFANMVESAKCRSIADWVVGCNLTAAMTVAKKSKEIISIGRVQTPTLAMVVARDAEIRNFIPENYYECEGTFTTQKDETYKGVHQGGRFKSQEEANAVAQLCNGKDGFVKTVTSTVKERPVPELYDLNMLQMEANAAYGMSLDQTLDATQKLYEAGYVTYPRTDCRVLPEGMYGQIRKIQELLRQGRFAPLFSPEASEANMNANKRTFFNDSKLGAHYAIIPTPQIAPPLEPAQEKIYGLIVDSVIRMLYPSAKIASTRVITEVSGQTFESTGSTVKEKGWMVVHGDAKEELLPDLSEGDPVSCECAAVAKKTKPPKHYTDKTLLAAMMSAGKAIEDEDLRKFMAAGKIEGIGTVATRAGIIKSLIDRGFLERDKKSILATSRGEAVIQMLPVEEVKSAVMTAKYEKELDGIAKGTVQPDTFLNQIYTDLRGWCEEIKQLTPDPVPGGSVSGGGSANDTGLICPNCGGALIKYKWGYGCANYKSGCKFSIGTIAGKHLSDKQVKDLITKKKTGKISGFTKKDGSKFEAALIMEEEVIDGKSNGWKVKFSPFSTKKK